MATTLFSAVNILLHNRFRAMGWPRLHSSRQSTRFPHNLFLFASLRPEQLRQRVPRASTWAGGRSAGVAVRVAGRVTALESGLVDPAAAEVVAVGEERVVGD